MRVSAVGRSAELPRFANAVKLPLPQNSINTFGLTNVSFDKAKQTICTILCNRQLGVVRGGLGCHCMLYSVTYTSGCSCHQVCCMVDINATQRNIRKISGSKSSE
jgi:hypothetical protein